MANGPENEQPQDDQAEPTPEGQEPEAQQAEAQPQAGPPPVPEAGGALPQEPLAPGPELMEIPDVAPVGDLSAFDTDEPYGAMAIGSDDEALRKMGKRTSTFGRITAVLLLLGGGAAGYLAYRGNQNYEHRMDGVSACGDVAAQDAMLSCLRDELSKTTYDDVQERIIRNLGHFRDEQSVPTLIEMLDNAGIVRRAAALALARIGLPGAESAKAKLLEVLPDTDERDRPQVVWALAVLGESQAADEIITAFTAGLLQGQEGFDPKIITDVLGPERLGSDDLLTHREESVRVLTAQALAEAASPAVIDPLSRLINAELAREPDNRSSEVLRSAAAGLGRAGDARAARPLFALLERVPEQRQGVLDALQRSTAGPGIAVLIGAATDVSVKRDLVRLLAQTHDPRTADTLAGLLGSDDSEIKTTAALALADLSDERAVDTLVELAGLSGEENEGNADAALTALRRLGSPSAGRGLMALLPPACPDVPEPGMPEGCFRQAALLRAMGTAGDQSVGPRIETALAGDDSPAAAQALADLNYEPAYAKLQELAARPRDVDMAAATAADRSLENEDLLRKRRGALWGLGRYAREDSAETLMQVVEDVDDDYELRALAAAALGLAASAEVMRTVIGRIQDESVPEDTRRYYVQSLWQRPRRELNQDLLSLIAGNAPTEIRRSAALAVGYAADPANDERLMTMLDDPATRAEAAIAISLGGSVAAAHKLVQVLADDNDSREVLQYMIMGDNTWYSLLTEEMFESGEVWRRMAVSRVLFEGDGDNRYGYAWLKMLAVLSSGWDGAHGVEPAEARTRIYQGLTGDDSERRVLAAATLADMRERGLLLRARDDGGNGAVEARAQLRSMNRPQED